MTRLLTSGEMSVVWVDSPSSASSHSEATRWSYLTLISRAGITRPALISQLSLTNRKVLVFTLHILLLLLSIIIVYLGKQRGRPRETFWDKTFPSFQESQTIRKPLHIDDPVLEAEIAQYMSSHAPNAINSPPPHTPIPSLPTLHSYACSLPSLPSIHTPSTTEPPTPTSPVLTPGMAKLSLLAKQALVMSDKKGTKIIYITNL